MLGVGVRGTSDQRGGRSGWPAGGGAKVDSVQVVMVLVRGRVDCCMEIASLLKPMSRFRWTGGRFTHEPGSRGTSSPRRALLDAESVACLLVAVVVRADTCRALTQTVSREVQASTHRVDCSEREMCQAMHSHLPHSRAVGDRPSEGQKERDLLLSGYMMICETTSPEHCQHVPGMPCRHIAITESCKLLSEGEGRRGYPDAQITDRPLIRDLIAS